MRVLMILVILATILLSALIFISPANSTESWTSAVLLFASNGILWIIIAATFYDHYKRAKEAKNQALAITLGVLVIAASGMSFDSFYSVVFTAAAKGIVLPITWFDKFFNKPFSWAFSAVVYNLVAVVMLYLFQMGVIEQVFAEQEHRKKLEELTRNLEEKNRTLSTIDTISRAMNQSLDLRATMQELTQQIVRQFKVDLCTVRLINIQDELVVDAFNGEHTPDLTEHILKSDEGPAGWVFTQQRLFQANNVQKDNRISNNDPLIRSGVQSYIGLPLNIPMRGCLGCLELYTFKQRDFTQGEVEAFTMIANEAAISIQNARNYEEAEQRRRELESLNLFSSNVDSSNREEEIYKLFLKELGQQFDLSQVILLRRSSEGDFMEIAASLNPLSKKQSQMPILEDPGQCRAIRTGKDKIVQDVQEDLICDCELLVPKQGSYLCQPLNMSGKTLGLVHMSSNQINYWDADKHRIVSSFAAVIAPAIGNIRLMELEKLRATTDQLTQVFNRRFLDEHLTKHLYGLKRQPIGMKSPLSILMLDLDHFKSYNDSYGHEIGDQVLQAFGSTLVATVRSSDLVARYGGEEFCIVLQGTDLKGAKETAEKIRTVTPSIELSAMGTKLPRKITVSIGIAVYPEHGTTTQELLKKADQALYEAKAQGRNKICVAEIGKQEYLFSNTKSRKNSL